MLFNSVHFLFFFPLAVAAYFAFPYRFRWVLLVVAGYYFYACWKPAYLILIVLSTLVDYVAGILMEGSQTQRTRRLYLVLSLCSNLGLLFFFKYYNFFMDTVRPLVDYLDIGVTIPASHLLLPVGLSFYTFQSLTYTIGVYRGTVKAERHVGIFAAYVCFWPQLVAGPIERAQHLIPQLYERHVPNEDDITQGLRLMLWGMFKKVVIADRLAVYVNSVYNNVAYESAPAFLLATYVFAFQIYCDFSGYSDIAIGAARVMGYRLTTNFNKPYSALSVPEFWRRWHISLSTWFRDFVYIPLGGNRVSPWRRHLNLFLVFLVSGLWHGANWTFVIWGALHGAYMVCSVLTADARDRWRAALVPERAMPYYAYVRVFITFNLCCIGWMLFRANSLADAWFITKSVLSFDMGGLSIGSTYQFIYGVFGIIVLLMFEKFQRRFSMDEVWARYAPPFRWALYCFLAFTILLIGVFDGGQFIYFQF